MSHPLPFQKVAILGGGLLGGSIALALEPKTPATLHFRKAQAVTPAQNLGISLATSELATAVKDADLLILAVPIGAMPALVEQALKAGLPSTCLITDVGSVKQAPHSSLGPILRKTINHFIGSHPMAGSEQNGLVAASADLFNGAACLLTNDSKAPQLLCDRLEHFWKTLGCHTHWQSATEHDSLVARISHLPHITAAATSLSALKNPGIGKFGGGGLRDTTRVAGGNPTMWAEILTENRQAVLPVLRETIAELREILATLEKPDQQAAHQWLAKAKTLRDTLQHTL